MKAFPSSAKSMAPRRFSIIFGRMCLQVPLQSVLAWKALREVLATLHHTFVRTDGAVAALRVALHVFRILECFAAAWAGVFLVAIWVASSVIPIVSNGASRVYACD